VLGKLDGLSEYDARRPLTPTGTNLLGLVKHVASVRLGYIGEVFDRPSGRAAPWDLPGADPDDDMWAAADETREQVVELHRASAEHGDATVVALPLHARGSVPWWPPERREVTLGQVLVHLCVETARHAGHADVLRELLDGAVGNGPDDANAPGRDAQEWAAYRERIEQAARAAQRQAERG
jgi:uncharacterized damage-inducible protein DinB